MKSNVLLISKDANLEDYLQISLSPKGFEVHITQISDIMQKCFVLSPRIIIVDINILSQQILQVIKSILDIDYIPIIYVGDGEKFGAFEELQDEIILERHNVAQQILNLVRLGAIFKKEYDKVSHAYDTMDALTTDTKNIIERYWKEGDDTCFLNKEIINSIFRNNPVLRNKPDIIWLVSNMNTYYIATMLRRQRKDDSYNIYCTCDVSINEEFGFDLYAENGFKVNLMEEGYSDIDVRSDIFPKSMSSRMDKVVNFAGYGMDQIIIIGCNYELSVSSYEASILKSATVTLDLLENIQNKIKEVDNAFNYTLDALARAAEASDDSTGKHIRRVNEYAKLIAVELGMDQTFINEIYNSAQMHDVGKIYVDNSILRKNGKLDDFEFDEIKRHTIYGERIVGNSSYLKMAAEIALNHHEKYDGSGYPYGKKGLEIPISARIVTLADIYDALRSPRSYKEGFTHEVACKIILEGDGRVEPSHFDPDVLEVFRRCNKKFNEIYNELSGE